ncbi:class I SAM-dependent methyltransferase [Dokdonella sp.]|uniref:class I SAM-dependent methyltransferase n=1 Tax=Dokdonella sp. TaxID=2291710 RepID=UPI0037851B7C
MSVSDIEAVLEALFLPLSSPVIDASASQRGVFLRARAGSWLRRWPGMTCVQTFKPFADELVRAGASLAAPGDGSGLVLLLPPRQRDEARALFAQAVRLAGNGGIVVACQPNNEGARSGEADLARLVGNVQSLSKHKCRVYWSRIDVARVDNALLDEWQALDAPRPIAGGNWLSRPGLFAWDRVDAASALLVEHLPRDLRGRVADLGAGYGFLAAEVVRRCAAVEAIDLYEAEQRAEEPARANLERACRDTGRDVAFTFRWHDVTRGLGDRYDAIVSNPPFHQGRADQPELGRAFIEVAADALQSSGVLWLVANRHLAYEATLAAHFEAVRIVEVRDGFKVIEARNPKR